jgi:XTP/dITP diphosphohydrolase
VNKLVFATNNSKKIEEVIPILHGYYEILSLADIGFYHEIIENADTFQGNAYLKASAVWRESGMACFADDSGLVVPALNGDPGVKSARYAAEFGVVNHEANNQKLLKSLENISERSAYFITVICLMLSEDEVHYFEGRVSGTIAMAPRGTNGFGYDPLFIPEDYNHTFAELGSQIKNTISHRALAVQEMHRYLSKR